MSLAIPEVSLPQDETPYISGVRPALVAWNPGAMFALRTHIPGNPPLAPIAYSRGDVRILDAARQASEDDFVSSAVARITADGASFAIGNAEPVRIARMPMLLLLLSTLVRGRIEHPERWLTLAELTKAIWPDANLRHDVLRKRTYVLVSRLRAMGLINAIESSTKDSWRLALDVEIVLQLPRAEVVRG